MTAPSDLGSCLIKVFLKSLDGRKSTSLGKMKLVLAVAMAMVRSKLLG